jgi:hypothetical protein
MALAVLQPCLSWESSLLVLAVYSGNWNDLELVQLPPWPSGMLSLSILTWLEYSCDILVCMGYGGSWTNRLVFNNDGHWCGPLQPVPPHLFNNGLHRLIWVTEGKLSCRLVQFTTATTMVFKASVRRRLGIKASSVRFGKTAALGA